MPFPRAGVMLTAMKSLEGSVGENFAARIDPVAVPSRRVGTSMERWTGRGATGALPFPLDFFLEEGEVEGDEDEVGRSWRWTLPVVAIASWGGSC